ncbi:MAG: DNA-directed RNA polymerase subunit beta [Microbacteriaceae bacterium]
MAKEFHRPVVVNGAWLEYFASGKNPEETLTLAQQSATLLMNSLRGESAESHQRLLEYIRSQGIEDLAEIWSHAPHPSLPAALWRVYLVREFAIQDPAQTSAVYRIGMEAIDSSDIALVGAAEPVGPNDVVKLAEQILHGVFTGDFVVALNRAAAFCRICSVGCTQLADSTEFANPKRASTLTTRAYRLSEMAAELSLSAELWRDKKL